MSVVHPKMILLFSGKRKSGKDTITDLIYDRVKSVSVNIKISAPIKSHFAELHKLDFEKLMGMSSYKEQYRLDMIQWSEKIRKSDFGYFCRAAIEMTNAEEKPIWIVSDIRRKTDLQWFNENYKNTITVRVLASELERSKRGWVFTEGIDDQESECDLDIIDKWDVSIENNGTLQDIQPQVDKIVSMIENEVQRT